MNPSESGNPHEGDRTIRIDPELYDRLRRFCDRESIRFRDFVDSALAEAVETETRAMLLESEIAKLKEKAVKYDYAFNRGFQQGFAFFYCLLNGLSVSDTAAEGLEIVRRFPAVAPKGDQLTLF
jgi:hypothetical protein